MNYKNIIFSSGIKKIPHITKFLEIVRSSLNLSSQDVVFGWGFKPNTQKARQYAKNNNLLYIALEDAFLRSVGLGVKGIPPLGIIFDDLGIYYDAKQSSRLEQLIINSSNLTIHQVARANRCIEQFKKLRLTKYNDNYISWDSHHEHPKIVVIDQTLGDVSVQGALSDKSTFIDMLNFAMSEHPDEIIWIKTHPDVISGKKKGYLNLAHSNKRVKICSDSINPWDFFSSVKHVYTVSSLMGFEALLAGCKVTCFGVPFYAGWGLTTDKKSIDRRNVSRSLEQIFYSAYIEYAKYIDPVLGINCELEDIINTIEINFTSKKSPTLIQLNNVSNYKFSWLKHFFTYANLEVSSSEYEIKVGWGRQEEGISIEDGFVRSIGLGASLIQPISLVFDKKGIYFDATRESDLENLLNYYHLTDYDKERAKKLIDLYLRHRISKYNIGVKKALSFNTNKKKILVIGQVEGDASLKYGALTISKNQKLIQCVRKANPEAFLIYKPHPDVVAGFRDDGNWRCDSLDLVDHVEIDSTITELYEHIDELHTITSLSGFEALVHGVKVVTYGMPFYAGWGLTTDNGCCNRRNRVLTLEELVFCTLIKYPYYLLPKTSKPLTPEQAILFLSLKKGQKLTVFDRVSTYCLLLVRSLKKYLRSINKTT